MYYVPALVGSFFLLKRYITQPNENFITISDKYIVERADNYYPYSKQYYIKSTTGSIYKFPFSDPFMNTNKEIIWNNIEKNKKYYIYYDGKTHIPELGIHPRIWKIKEL